MNDTPNRAIVPYGDPPVSDALPAIVDERILSGPQPEPTSVPPMPENGTVIFPEEPSLYRIRFAALVTRLEGDVAIGC